MDDSATEAELEAADDADVAVPSTDVDSALVADDDSVPSMTLVADSVLTPLVASILPVSELPSDE